MDQKVGTPEAQFLIFIKTGVEFSEIEGSRGVKRALIKQRGWPGVELAEMEA